MDYLKFSQQLFRAPEFIGATSAQNGVFIKLCAYCALNENGGVLHGAAHWTERKWMGTCFVSLEEVQDETELWHIEGDDVIVDLYPLEAEEALRDFRALGAKGGKLSGQKRAEKSTQTKTNPPSVKNEPPFNPPSTKNEPPFNPPSPQPSTPLEAVSLVSTDSLESKEEGERKYIKEKNYAQKSFVFADRASMEVDRLILSNPDGYSISENKLTLYRTWIRHRSYTKPLSPTLIEKDLMRLKVMPFKDAESMINKAIDGGWETWFYPDSNRGSISVHAGNPSLQPLDPSASFLNPEGQL
jgi:hypothetical protein